MRKWALVFLTVVSALAAQDITFSKDTYLVKPLPAGDIRYIYDTVTIFNSGPDAVTLDSAIVEFQNLDTAWYMHGPPYIRMNEIDDGEMGMVLWELDSLEENTYLVIQDTSTNLLSIGPSGDSTRLTNMRVGSCINCAAVYPLSFSHAVLRLYYSNGQAVELNLVDADGITVSKDSLWVYNNSVLSRSDGVIFYNYGIDSVVLDSLVIQVEEFDTTGLQPGKTLEAGWIEFMFTDSLGTSCQVPVMIREDSSFLIEWETGGTAAGPLSRFGPGDSVSFGHFQIGQCLVCSELPTYPKYVRGNLYLYFDNGDAVELQLYSDDWREPIKVRRSFQSGRQNVFGATLFVYLINGRRICRGQKRSVESGAGNVIVIDYGNRIKPALSGVGGCRAR